MLRVAVLSKADESGGGASRVAVDLARGLRAAGHHAVHWASFSAKGQEHPPESLYGKGLGTLGFLAHNVVRKVGFGEIVPFELPNLALSRIQRHFDVLHVHDISSAISPYTVSWLSRRLPTVWTVHDCSPFTGGCLYPMDCEKFKTGCGDCPGIGQWPLNCWLDQTRFLLKVKKHVHAHGRIALLAPSDWIAGLAFSSGHVRTRPSVIANGVDTRVFAPAADRKEVRASLGIPQDRPVILITATSLSDPRKGGHAAISAIRGIADLRPFVIAVGRPSAGFAQAINGLDHLETGYLTDRTMLARIYQSADLHLFPSLAESFGLTVIETMACGVPTIGYAAGGMRELVQQGVTGWLVEIGDLAGLVSGLRHALGERRVAVWGLSARELAVERFSMESFVDQHVSFYQSLIASRDS